MHHLHLVRRVSQSLLAILFSLSSLLGNVGGIGTLQAQADSSAVDSSTTIKVTTQEDEWNTPALPNKTSPTKCSLREALQAAFNPGEGDRGCKKVNPASEYVLDLSLPGTYTLTRLDVLPNIKNKIKINGKSSRSPSLAAR